MSQKQKMQIEFMINGKKWRGEVHPLKRLLDTIREDVNLKGTKEGCGEGECGACMILLDGKPILSCLTPTCQANGRSITTIEGIEEEGKLHPVQESFVHEGGTQCGMCTPGMIISTVAYQKNPESAQNISQALAGNLCRCTGYTKILSSCEKHCGNDKQEHRIVYKQRNQ